MAIYGSVGNIEICSKCYNIGIMNATNIFLLYPWRNPLCSNEDYYIGSIINSFYDDLSTVSVHCRLLYDTIGEETGKKSNHKIIFRLFYPNWQPKKLFLS